MLQILITAETVNELYNKTLTALGLVMQQQANLPLPDPKAALESLQQGGNVSHIKPAAPAAAEEPARRTRRSKAEVEAERQAKNSTAKTAKEKIENNFAAADELDEEIESPVEADDDLVGDDEDSAPNATFEQAGEVMKKFLAKFPTPEALKILQKHGIKKLSEAKENQAVLGKFVRDANNLLAGKQ